METKYDFKQVEENKYSYWLEKDLFKAGKDKALGFLVAHSSRLHKRRARPHHRPLGGKSDTRI